MSEALEECGSSLTWYAGQGARGWRFHPPAVAPADNAGRGRWSRATLTGLSESTFVPGQCASSAARSRGAASPPSKSGEIYRRPVRMGIFLLLGLWLSRIMG